ncbi:unnamed protein product, partial [Meganyctiphanes norvegica]
MSTSIVKEDCEENFALGNRLNSLSYGKDFEVKRNNEISIKLEENYYKEDVLWKSEHGSFDVKVKLKFEVNEEPIHLQAVEQKIKKEIEIYEEPIAFKGKKCLVKHDLSLTEENPYKCSFSNKAFPQNKQIHQSTNARVVIQRLNLSSITMPVHTETNLYASSQCAKDYSNKNSFNDHRITHINEKPHQCRQCDKRFSYKRDFIKHKKSHTGGKAHQCSQCNMTFSKNSNLVKHRRSHTWEKPYQCSQCGKAFSQNGNLKRHQSIHTREKPYQCSQCGKAFSDNGNLKRHQFIHTGEKPHK